MGEATMLEAAGPVAEVSATPQPSAAASRRRPWMLGATLLAIYIALMFVFNLHGTVGADTGPKVATLRTMDQHSTFVPEVGYWAKAQDPHGLLHPLLNTIDLHGHYVAVTTVPMLVAAAPLDRLGGDRLALLLPMLGAIGCAYAARALARRLGSRSPDAAFWVVGLASPLVVYGLDFWEHSLGLCFMLWGFVFLFDVIGSRSGYARALAAGALFGLAATMRTEALAYSAVATAIVLVFALWRSRRLVQVIGLGLCVSAGLLALLAANDALERLLLGGSLRSSRAVNTAGAAGGSRSVRLQQVWHTSIGFGLDNHDLLISLVFVCALGFAAWAAVHARPAREVWAPFALAALIVVLRVAAGTSFVPGLVAAFPIAAAGLVLSWDRWGRRLTALVALVALPVVWYSQYTASTDWAGRYVLMTCMLLGILGVVGLVTAAPKLLWAIVGLCVVMNGFGLVFLSQRSDEINALARRVSALREDVVVSRDPLLFRYVGAQYDESRQWLTASSDDQFAQAVDIAGAHRAKTIAVLSFDPSLVHKSIAGWRETESTEWKLHFVGVFVTRYTRTA